ncbi:MAG: SMC-Scp complex subunit ScpB [Eubacteriales bacterium]|nr:SMC-Scp complex subunit ScpB [Eubacteriales bacterium]MDD4390390.1 SMC-Scp complex subunit ScpB [Eubacteriales bacterium]
MSSNKVIKAAFESMMFTWGEPLDVKLAADVFGITSKEAYDIFNELKGEYDSQGRGIRIREINKAFQFVTSPDVYDYIERLCTPSKQKKLSQAALEVLAIIAYKQPVTRGEIEAVRGIKCERVLEGLENKNLIEEVGRSPGIGRPILYGTTDMFLRNFGFTSINELPDIDDIESVVHEQDEEGDSSQVTFNLSQGNMK